MYIPQWIQLTILFHYDKNKYFIQVIIPRHRNQSLANQYQATDQFE